MKRAVTIGLAAAAIAIALSSLATGGTERNQIEFANYQRGARIIRVPQPGDRDEDSVSLNRRDRAALPHDDDGDELPPPAPRRRVTPAKPQVRSEPRAAAKESVKELPETTIKQPAQTPAARNAPRWKPRSEAPPPPPPPSGPRRAVLSAPPPLAEGPTPLRPTPDFESRVGAAEKFLGPPPSDVSEIAPQRGYKPPALPALPDASQDTGDK